MPKSVFVNFSKNNTFGCDQHCPFCEWTKQNFNTYYCPSKEDLKLFNNNFPDDEKWQISGGGDPLYNFEENWPKLKELINNIHSLGHKVQILTRKIDVVNKYFDILKDYVDYWYFSVDYTISSDLKSVSSKLTLEHTYVNLVLNIKEDESLNWEKIEQTIKEYEPYVNSIIFRNNFIHPISHKLYREVREKLKNISEKTRFIPHSTSSIVLFLGKIMTCKQIDEEYLKIKNK